MPDPENILIVKLSAIGDVVHSLPFLEVLKENFPGARIEWLVEEDAAEIIEGHPAIDRIIVSRRRSWQDQVLRSKGFASSMREIKGFIKRLRREQYDWVIDLQGLFKSGVLTGLSRGNRKVGMGGAREGSWFFLTETPVSVNYEQHAIDRYLQLAEYLGCRVSSWKGEVPVFESDKKKVDQMLNTNGLGEGGIVAINPMAKWRTKLWEPDRFAALADRIHDELNCSIVFTGSRGDRSLVEVISGMMKKRSTNLAGKTTLKELSYLYTRCEVLVSTDTGPMHMAAAMGCPVVALFGPTAPWRTGPYGAIHRFIRTGIACSPCFRKRCGQMTCMKKINTGWVFDAVREFVKK